jgi:pterin-4a-carbinolamine dehydratase
MACWSSTEFAKPTYDFHNYHFFSTNRIIFDPTARKPNQKCDPYGQKGKPLSYDEASLQLQTLDEGWVLMPRKDTSVQSTKHVKNPSVEDDDLPQSVLHLPPTSLMKRFSHSNYLDASKFTSIISAVAHNNHHYPTITIQRRLLQKSWEINTIVSCHTQVLNGLSYHDFYIAMMIDVEVNREEVARLLMDSKEK